HGDQQGQHRRDEGGHHDDAEDLATIVSIFEAENDTPERSPMSHVVASRSVTLTGVKSPRPRTSPETLTVMTSRVPPSPTKNRWTWLRETPLGSSFCCLVSK